MANLTTLYNLIYLMFLIFSFLKYEPSNCNTTMLEFYEEQ